MSEYQMMRHYLEAFVTVVYGRARDDERGASDVAVQIVLIGTAVIAAAAIAAILWQKLTDGANSTPTPAPAGP